MGTDKRMSGYFAPVGSATDGVRRRLQTSDEWTANAALSTRSVEGALRLFFKQAGDRHAETWQHIVTGKRVSFSKLTHIC